MIQVETWKFRIRLLMILSGYIQWHRDEFRKCDKSGVVLAAFIAQNSSRLLMLSTVSSYIYSARNCSSNIRSMVGQLVYTQPAHSLVRILAHWFWRQIFSLVYEDISLVAPCFIFQVVMEIFLGFLVLLLKDLMIIACIHNYFSSITSISYFHNTSIQLMQ